MANNNSILNKVMKMSILVIFLLSIISMANAFDINIISPTAKQYNTSAIQLKVNFTENYDNWSYVFNSQAQDVCTLIHPIQYDYAPHDQTVGNFFNLYGSNDAQIRFDNSVIPQVAHQQVNVCFLLNDKDAVQENSFKFRVNNKGTYTITDDTSLPVGTWTWKCIDLNASDFAKGYNITMWYENRSDVGGIYLANNDAETSSRSYYNYDASNPPNQTDQAIAWTLYSGNTDWVVNLTVITAPQYCPLNNSIPLTAQIGFNNVLVNATLVNGSNYLKSVNFEYIKVDTVTMNPSVVNVSINTIIQASVLASDPLDAKARIVRPGGQIINVTLYDDGNHNDGAVGDKIYGNIYSPTIAGRHNLTVIFNTSQGARAESSLYYFNAVTSFAINILPPMKAEYNSTLVPINVSISDVYDTWKYSLNGQSYIKVCDSNFSNVVQVNFNTGLNDDSWALNGNNDAQIRFDSSVVPQYTHQSVRVCFLLYDNSDTQENSLQFRVNNKTVYTIADDASLPLGVWTWKCANLSSSDFAQEYNITAWYSNRALTGGVQLGNNIGTPGSSSYFDTGALNAPTAYDSNIPWVKYSDNTDWMINLTVVTKTQLCPLASYTVIDRKSVV